MRKQIIVGIAEDQGLVREGIVSMLKKETDIKVLLEAVNGKELLDKLKKTKIDILLLDLEMPVVSGHEAFTIIKTEYPEIKIIIVSALYKRSFVVEYVKKGTNAFLPKDCSMPQLMETISGVYNRGTHYNAEILSMLTDAVNDTKTAAIAEFTERELIVLRLMCEDKSSKEIAETLQISIRTVEWHRTVLLQKANVNTPSALAIFAAKNKLIDL